MKTVLITGANKGIGFEVARQLGARGCRVFLGARRAEAGQQAIKKLQQDGITAQLLVLDVSDPASIAAAEKDFAETTLDVLINNAGAIVPDDNDILKLRADQLQATLATNTFGPLQMSQAFLSRLRRSDSPRIINVSSGGGQLTDGADGWAPAYCISKTALNGVTAQLAVALPEFAVNSVCPGWVRTDMGGASAPRSVAQGADTIVWLALEAPQNLTSQFWRDRQPLPW